MSSRHKADLHRPISDRPLIEAEDDQDAGLTNRVGATRSVAEAIMAGMGALRRLDPLMRNKYRNDPVKLAEWFTASPTGLAAFFLD